jgi:UDP-2,3-diacylglucosamine pyrophosphatase LpxH
VFYLQAAPHAWSRRELRERVNTALAFSDQHIYDNSKSVTALCDVIRQRQPDLLVMVGDIGDPWVALWQDIFDTEPWHLLDETLSERDNNIWVKGNHDWNAKQGFLENTEVCSRYEAEIAGQRWLFIHGHQVDISWSGIWRIPGLSTVAFWLSLHAPWLMVPIYNFIYRRKTPGIQKQQAAFSLLPTDAVVHPVVSFDDWNLHVGVIHDRARLYAQKKQTPIVLGHTHCERSFDGLIADCGDSGYIWIDKEGAKWNPL